MRTISLEYIVPALVAVFVLAAASAFGDGVLASKHDLSVVGGGAIKASTETEVCIFCHTPHRATGQAPLWNHQLSVATYTPYTSSTIKATVGQPTGASKLCLSCHDGTVALGMVNSRMAPLEMQNGITTMPAGRTRIGTDLSDDHPVSFTYNAALAAANGQLKDPGTLTSKVRLDKDNQMQCTSCHNPHDNQYGKFLVQANIGSALCLNCHDVTHWQNSSHRTSAKTWTGAGIDPWPNTDETTVANNACQSCHTPHGAGTKPRLLTHANEEHNCFSCHSGNVASKDIQSEFNKTSVHPILTTTGVHDPMEDPVNPPRHVECADCHNPHAAKNAPATAPTAPGALAGVAGINSSGSLVNPISNEYELCYRCHADSVARGPAKVPRHSPETNKRNQFNTANASFHPVEAMGKNPNVPSLIAPYSETSRIYCTDCHNSDNGPGAGGTGPRGPHGSIHEPLLERALTLTDGAVESATAYALCYKCHNQASILNNESFPGHFKHVSSERIACTTCHDSHGTVLTPGLINFNTTYVTPSTSNGRLEYIRNGTQYTCSLTCHGEDHDAESY